MMKTTTASTTNYVEYDDLEEVTYNQLRYMHSQDVYTLRNNSTKNHCLAKVSYDRIDLISVDGPYLTLKNDEDIDRLNLRIFRRK